LYVTDLKIQKLWFKTNNGSE